MTPERWEQISRLYHAALARAEQERPTLLAEACAGDEALRREVELLLAQEQRRLKAFSTNPPLR